MRMSMKIFQHTVAISTITCSHAATNVNAAANCYCLVKDYNRHDTYALGLYEPPHEKTNKTSFAPSEDSDQPGQSLRCPHKESLDP